MTELHPAYVAGMIDADGHIGWHGRDRAPRVGVTNLSHELLKALAAQYGGSVRDRGDRVCPEGCDRQHVHVRAVCYAWSVTGARAVVLLRTIRPWLFVKGERADDALARWDAVLGQMERPARRVNAIRRAEVALHG